MQKKKATYRAKAVRPMEVQNSCLKHMRMVRKGFLLSHMEPECYQPRAVNQHTLSKQLFVSAVRFPHVSV